jgi:S-formylglutathione hydrolase FrmB
VPDLTGEDTISGLADSVLAEVPAKRFALAGLSMGGYVALEVITAGTRTTSFPSASSSAAVFVALSPSFEKFSRSASWR